MWSPLKSLFQRSIYGSKRVARPIVSRKRIGRARTYARLDLETLEDRIVPTIYFTDQLSHVTAETGEAGLSDVQVHLVIWNGVSSQFGSGSSYQQLTTAQIFQTISAAQALLASPWLSDLPGSSDGVATFAGDTIDTNPLPSKLTLGAISNEINVLNLPTGAPWLYVFVTPSNYPGDHSSDNGYNWVPLSLNGLPTSPIAWDIDQENVAPGSANDGWSVDNLTLTLSHEIAECMSSPDDLGYMVENNPFQNNPSGMTINQICDGEQSNYYYRESNGVLVEPYYFGNGDYFEVPDGSPDANFLLSADNPGDYEQSGGYGLVLGDWGGFGNSVQNGQFTIATSALNLPAGGSQEELTITANGQTAQFDEGTIHSIDLYLDPNMANTLTLDGIPTGITFNTFYSQTQNFTLNVVADSAPALAGSHSVSLNATSLTVDGNTLSFVRGQNAQNQGMYFVPSNLELGGAGCIFTIRGTPPNVPVSIDASGGNNIILAEQTDEYAPLTVNASQGDMVTVGQNGTIDGIFPNSVVVNGGSLTVDASKETSDTQPLMVASDEVSFGPEPGSVVSVAYSAIEQLTVNSGPQAPNVYVDSSSCPVTVNPSPNSNCLVSLFGTAPASAGSLQGLVVDDSTDPADNNPITVTSTKVEYGQANSPIVIINSQKMKQVTVNGGPNTPMISVESTSVPTIINPLGSCTVSVSPTAQNLNQIGQLTVNGSGSTPLILHDTNAAGASKKTMYYNLTQSVLTRELLSTASLPKVGMAPPTSTASTTKVMFSALESLTLNMTNSASQLDVAGTAAATTTTIQAGTGTATVNLTPASRFLTGIVGLLNVLGTSNTTLNLYDQAQATRLGPNVYTFTDGVISRTAFPDVSFQPGNPPTTTVTVDYSGVGGLSLWSAASNSNIEIQGTAGAPLAIHAGTPSDQITVTPPTVAGVTGSGLLRMANLTQHIGALTIAGDGASLTVDGSAIRNLGQANPNGSAAVADDNTALFTVTNQAVTYGFTFTEVTQQVTTKAGNTSLTTATVQKQYSLPINYTNLQDLTLTGGPVSTTFNVQSTASGTPVNINGESGTTYFGHLSGKKVAESGSATSNTFTLGNNGSVKNILSKVTFDPAGGAVTVDDSQATTRDQVTLSNGAAGDVQVGKGPQDKFFGAGGWLDCVGISELTLNLSNAAGDAVQAVPSAVTEFFVNGNGAQYPGAGAASLNVTGATIPMPSFTNPGAGSYPFTSPLQVVNFSNVQTAAPTIKTMTPHMGPPTGNTSILITGTGFTGATGVSFGGVPALSFTVKSATQIMAVAPPEVANVASDYDMDEEKLGEETNPNANPPMTLNPTVDVTITTPTGGPSAIVTADRYTYVSPMPTLAIAWAPPTPVTYGAALSAVQLDATANIPGSFSYSPAAGTVLGAGLQQLLAIFTPTDTTDYPSVTAVTQFVVGQAAPSVTTNPVNLGNGTPLDDSQLSGTATATVNGQLVNVPGNFFYSNAGADGTILGVGQNQSESVTFIPADAIDFGAVQTTAVVNVTTGQLTPQVSVDAVSLTFGTALDDSQLSGTATWDGQPIAGTFSYGNGVGSVLDAGAQPQTVAVTFTPTDSTDYTAVNTSAPVTVNPAAPTIEVSDASGPYTGAPFSATATVTGISGSPESALEGIGLTLDYQQVDANGHVLSDLGATAPTAPGNYQAIASFPGSPDYASGSSQTTFTIGQPGGLATPTVQVSDVNGAYNGQPFTATATVTGASGTPEPTLEGVGLIFDYQELDGNGNVLADLGAAAPTAAGRYQVIASFAGSADYTSANSAPFSFTISQVTPQVTVIPVDIGAGTALDDSQLSGTATALVNGQTVAVDGSFAYSTAVGTVLGAGPGQTESVTFTPGDNIDFSVVQVAVTVNVNAGQSLPQLVLNPVNITYGTVLDSSQLSGTANFNGQPVSGSFTYTTAAGALLDAGQAQSELVTFTPDDSADFSAAQADVTVNVFQASPQATVNPVNFDFGTVFDNSQLSGTATAFVNGQTLNVPGTFTYTDNGFIGSVLGPPGQYSLGVTFTPNDTTDYQTIQTDVTVNVFQTPLQATVNPVNFDFGTVFDNSQLSGTATAFVNGQTLNVPGTFTYTDNGFIGSVLGPPGQYSLGVTFTPNDTTDYQSIQTDVTVNVFQTPLQATVNPVNFDFGTVFDNSQLSGTATAFVDGETLNVPGSFTYTDSGLLGSVLGPPGQYSLGVTFTPNDATDYQTIQTDVTVNVFQTPLQMTVNPVNFDYGTAFDNSQLSGTATAFANGQSVNVPGTFIYTVSSFIGSVLGPPGQYSLGVTFTPNDSTDYQTVQSDVTVNVSQATPQVSVNTVNVSAGTALANSQLSGAATAVTAGVTGSIAGTFTYTSAAGAVLGAGQGQIEQVTFTPTDSADYSSVQSTVAVNVTTNTTVPQVTVNAMNITYGTAFANAQLSGSAHAIVNGNTTNVPGTFTYTSVAGMVFGAGQPLISVTFTPNDTTDFDTVQLNTTVTIGRATPLVSMNQVTITYGTALANSQLAGRGTASAVVGGVTINVPGTFTWTNAVGSLFSAGTQSVAVTFTPTDTTDFTTVATTAQLNVRAAQPTISTPASSLNPATDEDSVTFTVVVQAPATGTPQGTVTFFDGTTLLGTVNLQTVNGKQQAGLLAGPFSLGMHSITAVYSDTVDGDFADVTSAALQLVVNEQIN